MDESARLRKLGDLGPFDRIGCFCRAISTGKFAGPEATRALTSLIRSSKGFLKVNGQFTLRDGTGKVFYEWVVVNEKTMWTRKGVGGNQEPAAAWAQTLSSFVNQAVTKGYTESFKITGRGLYAISGARYFRPEQIRVIDTFHIEVSTLLEPSIIYILESFDGIKGTLIDAGNQATAFIKESETYLARVSRFNRHHC